MAKTTKLVGYGISFDMKLVGGTKTADDFTRVAKSVQKGLNSASNATKSFEIAQEQLNQALRNGAISQKEYEDQLTRLRFRELKRQEQLEKQRRAVLGLDKQESILAKNRQNRARMAGMAAAGVSGLGLGGRAAGAARFLGGVAGLGGPAAALGLGFGALAMVKESISAFADLETKVASLKSLFGEPLGEKLTVQFRNLAKTTILTKNQLIENAKTWASYGLTTDGLTDRLRRLGTVAGGNSEKFRALTIAFAQVNAQGKLMGQEKNQLINAGFSLQAVADAAGISMENFADAMKNGEIRAEHLNEALIKVTSEGGLFAGYLEKQAETLQGKMTILSSTWEEFLQTLGRAEKGPAAAFLDKLIYAAEILKDAAEWWGGEDSPMSSLGGARQAGKGRPEATLLGEAGGAAFVDQEPIARRGRERRKEIMRARGVSSREAERIYQEELRIQREQAADNKRLHDYEMETARIEREMLQTQEKAFETRLQKQIERISFGQYSMTEFQSIFEQTVGREDEKSLQDQMLINWNKWLDKLADPFAPYRDQKTFVGPLPQTFGQMEQSNKLIQDQIDDLEDKKAMAQERHDFEMALLKMQEADLNQRLAQEKKIAAGPAERDAMFTGGSVEEFMFLRRQTQANEAAKATKEAEDRAQEQRERLARQKDDIERARDETFSDIAEAIKELSGKINALQD